MGETHGLPAVSPPTRAAAAAGLRWGFPGPRAAVRLAGTDAAKFLDNFVTAAVSKLADGEGAEGFVTDAKGWVLAFVQILRTTDGVLLDADSGRGAATDDGPMALGERLRAHLEHYHIREKVEIEDLSHDRSAIVLVGDGATAWLGIPIPAGPLSHGVGRIAGITVRAIRIPWLGSEALLLLAATATAAATIGAALAAEGVPRMSVDVIEAARIEQGFPFAGDIPEKTLPQELGRDSSAISFTKGCYLGQETVARIDAIGHVNRRLTGLAVEGAAPARLGVVAADGEPVGTVTSSCHSHRLGAALALAIVHEKASAARSLTVGGRPARFVDLPVRGLGEAAETSRRVVFEARRFRVVSVDETLADGSHRAREIVEHPGSVVILPIVEDKGCEPRLCLVENWRVAVGGPLLELPAGTLDRDEPLEEAARRELAEETGYRAGRIVHAASFWMSPGILRERMHVFRAESLAAGEQALEPGERIVVRLVAWSEAVAMCIDGRIDDAKSIAAIMLEEARRRSEPTA